MLTDTTTLPELREWQARLLAERTEARLNVLASPRTGKTRYACEWLLTLPPGPVVVSAPLRVCPLWVESLEAQGLSVISAFDRPTSQTKAALRRGWTGVLVINVDKLHPLRDVLVHAQAFICDEVHETSSQSSQRGRAARMIARRVKFYRGLTGTAITNHHGSLWAPLVMAGEFSGSWGSFMDEYTRRDTYFPSKVLEHLKPAELYVRVLRCSKIVRREDVFGPDTFQTIKRDIILPPEARALYTKLRRDWVLDEGRIQVDGTHTLARMTRLQQLTSGFLPNEDGGYETVHTAKIDAALGDLDEVFAEGEKAVIFHRFILEGQAMVEAIQRTTRVPTYVINGSLSAAESESQRAAFTRRKGAAAIVVQIQSGAVGISLAEATHALYLSRTFSFVRDEQSRDRIYKPGCVRTITHYACPHSVDTFIAKALSEKRDVHEALRYADVATIAGD